MLEVVVAGAVTGLAIAVPVGAVGALLVTLTARTSWRVGAAGALGIATVDGAYAALAVLAGATLAARLAPVAEPLRLVSGAVLLAVAALVARHAWTRREDPPGSTGSTGSAGSAGAAAGRPGAAYGLFVGVTALNPATVVYFAAVVLGNRDLVDGAAQGVAFVVAAFVASALWQLVLVTLGSGLGRVLTGPRGRRWTGLAAAAVIAGLALHTMLG